MPEAGTNLGYRDPDYVEFAYTPANRPPDGRYVKLWLRHPNWNGEIEGVWANCKCPNRSGKYYWTIGGRQMQAVQPAEWRLRE